MSLIGEENAKHTVKEPNTKKSTVNPQRDSKQAMQRNQRKVKARERRSARTEEDTKRAQAAKLERTGREAAPAPVVEPPPEPPIDMLFGEEPDDA